MCASFTQLFRFSTRAHVERHCTATTPLHVLYEVLYTPVHLPLPRTAFFWRIISPLALTHSLGGPLLAAAWHTEGAILCYNTSTAPPCLSPSPWKPYKPYNYSYHDPIIDTPGHCTAQVSPRNCQRAPTDHVGTIATSALDIFPRRRMSACIHRDNAQSSLAKTTAGQAKILRTKHEPPRILQPFPRRHTSPQPGHNALHQRRYHGARRYHVDVRHRELERGTNEFTRSLEL
jgi:hypothetical protein